MYWENLKKKKIRVGSVNSKQLATAQSVCVIIQAQHRLDSLLSFFTEGGGLDNRWLVEGSHNTQLCCPTRINIWFLHRSAGILNIGARVCVWGKGILTHRLVFFFSVNWIPFYIYQNRSFWKENSFLASSFFLFLSFFSLFIYLKRLIYTKAGNPVSIDEGKSFSFSLSLSAGHAMCV